VPTPDPRRRRPPGVRCDAFEHLSLEALVGGTLDGYLPGLSEVVDLVNGR
jgi:hypothetical protein